MSCKVALRSILLSIGSHAVPKESTSILFAESRRRLHTSPSTTTRPRDAPPFNPSSGQARRPVIKPQTGGSYYPDKFVFDLLSSIEGHLKDKPRDESSVDNDQGQTLSTSTVDNLLEVEDVAIGQEEVLTGSKNLGRVRDNKVEEKLGMISLDTWADISQSASELPEEESLEEQPLEGQSLEGHSLEEQSLEDESLSDAARIQHDATQDTVESAGNEDAQESSLPSYTSISAEKDILTPKQRILRHPKPTSIQDINHEVARRARLADIQLPQVPAQILSKDFKTAMLERKAKQAEHAEEIEIFLRSRHDFETFPPTDEWSIALSLLDSMTVKGSHVHTKRTELHSLPDGLKLAWTIDRNDAVLEIMLNTGSHLQTRQQDPTSDEFESFTLLGTLTENASARQFIVDKGFIVVSSSTSERSVAPNLQQLLADPRNRSFPGLDVTKRAPKADSEDPIDILRAASLASTRNDSSAVIGIRWATFPHRTSLTPIIKAAMKRVVLSSLQLNATVDFMTAAWTQDELRTMSVHFGSTNSTKLIGQALGRLLTTPGNVAATSSTTLVKAWGWLLSKKQPHILRKIQAAHDEYAARKAPGSFRAMGTAPFNRLLRSTGRARNIHMFRYMLKSMAERNIPADSSSWEQFFKLTQAMFPERSRLILKKMQEVGVLENIDLRLGLIPHYATEALNRELAAFESGHQLPAGFMESFLDRMSERLAEPRWMTSECARLMAGALLNNGHWYEALQICDRAGHDGWQIRSPLSYIFLQAAIGHGPMDAVMAVDALNRFSPRTTNERPRSVDNDATGPQGYVPPATSRHLFQNPALYDELLNIAIRGQSWNLVRVVWQHACCSGNVSSQMKDRLARSLSLYHNMTHYSIPSNLEQFWQTSWAIFAIGVGQKSTTLLGPRQKLPEELAQEAEEVMSRRRSDIAAYGKVTPINTLAEDARDAVKLDRERQEQYGDAFLMIDRGLLPEQHAHQLAQMLGHISTNGIVIPVKRVKAVQ